MSECTLDARLALAPLSEAEVGALVYELAPVAFDGLDPGHIALRDDGPPRLVAPRPAGGVETLRLLGIELAPPGPLRELLMVAYPGPAELRDALRDYAGPPWPATAGARHAPVDGPPHDPPEPALAAPLAPNREPPRHLVWMIAAAVTIAVLSLLPRHEAPQPPCEVGQVCAPAK